MKIITLYSNVLMPDWHLLFFIRNKYISEVLKKSLRYVLEKKSKQKIQEKIIPAFTHRAPRLAAILFIPIFIGIHEIASLSFLATAH